MTSAASLVSIFLAEYGDGMSTEGRRWPLLWDAEDSPIRNNFGSPENAFNEPLFLVGLFP